MRLIDADEFKKQIAGMAIANNYSADKANKICELIDYQATVFDVEKVIEYLDERLKHIRKEQSADCIKHDGHWTPEQGIRSGMIKEYLEILEVLKSAANATNVKNGG